MGRRTGMRYDKVLKARRRREKSLQMRTAQLEATSEQIHCHCRNLHALWKKAADELRKEVQENGGSTESDARLREQNLKLHRRRGLRRCRQVKEELDRVRNRLQKAMRSRRLLEKLREKHRRRMLRKQALREQRNLDSFSAQRYWQRTVGR